MVGVNCSKNKCVELEAKKYMNSEQAAKLIKLQKHFEERSIKLELLEKLKTTRWEWNMFYQWMSHSARQARACSCVTCYDSKRNPQLYPLLVYSPELYEYMSYCFA